MSLKKRSKGRRIKYVAQLIVVISLTIIAGAFLLFVTFSPLFRVEENQEPLGGSAARYEYALS